MQRRVGRCGQAAVVSIGSIMPRFLFLVVVVEEPGDVHPTRSLVLSLNFLCQLAVFFSRNKSANNNFNRNFSDQ